MFIHVLILVGTTDCPSIERERDSYMNTYQDLAPYTESKRPSALRDLTLRRRFISILRYGVGLLMSLWPYCKLFNDLPLQAGAEILRLT